MLNMICDGNCNSIQTRCELGPNFYEFYSSTDAMSSQIQYFKPPILVDNMGTWM